MDTPNDLLYTVELWLFNRRVEAIKVRINSIWIAPCLKLEGIQNNENLSKWLHVMFMSILNYLMKNQLPRPKLEIRRGNLEMKKITLEALNTSKCFLQSAKETKTFWGFLLSTLSRLSNHFYPKTDFFFFIIFGDLLFTVRFFSARV